jgi:mono/diheme cytochrome c family protein
MLFATRQAGQRRRRDRMTARWSLLALLVLATMAWADSAARGRQLFDGEVALPARIAGQDFALPAQPSRCINCHGPARGDAASQAAGAQRIGPTLTAGTLTDAVRRRGGPPSRYEAASLCALLRTGVDPAHVIILRTMPRYEIADADCRSLWLHLTDPPARR